MNADYENIPDCANNDCKAKRGIAMRRALERIYKLDRAQKVFTVEQCVLNIDLGTEDPYGAARKILGEDKLYYDDCNGYGSGPYIGTEKWDAWMGDSENLIMVEENDEYAVLKSMVGEEEANNEINYFYLKGICYRRKES